LYALTHPERFPDEGMRRFDPIAAGPLTFEPVRREVFGAFSAGLAAAQAGGTAPAVFNAANEVAVEAFLKQSINFPRIAETISQVLDDHRPVAADSLESVCAADAWARTRAREVLS
ncbi:MAG: 1-deoxy-D-xylulose-5-phosphate reductoisomerase, partial [Gemmatimonadales bacterium]